MTSAARPCKASRAPPGTCDRGSAAPYDSALRPRSRSATTTASPAPPASTRCSPRSDSLRRPTMSGRAIDGVLLVDKAPGMTSHDVVALARRALGTRRVGHAGTLDPFATGLLVILVGNATRLLPYAEGDPKVYEATIQFGAETDTGDPTGAVVREAPLPNEADVTKAMAQLTGSISQVPPAYSAK